MNEGLNQLTELVPSLYREARRHGILLAAMFAVIALAALVVGSFWPKTYAASTTILAQATDIIQPLMEGRAVPTSNTDRAGIARQVVFGHKVMGEIVKTGGWDSEPPMVQDRIIEDIKHRTEITSPRPELIQITYRDSDRKRTFDITQRMADLFIQESREAKQRESREAFEFIDSQVNSYHKKLTDAEDSLLKYRSAHVDAQPGSAADSNSRINALRTEVERARMSLMEQESSASAIGAQLSGEAQVTAVQTRESLYRAQLVDLQAQLDRLLLTYTEQYPDVVRTRHQIQDIQRQLEAEAANRANRPSGDVASAFDNAQFNPHYMELRRQLGDAQRQAAATRSRMGASESMLREELERGRRIAASESALAELTRDYEVNRDIYQDLLRRRENARVSMQLDREERGLTLRVQDPATMPLRPTGLRFMHFAIGGLLMAVGIPLGLLFLRARFDPRIRSAQQLQRITERPLLTVVPTYHSPRDRRQELSRNAMSFGILTLVILAYGLAFGLKQLAA